MSDGVQHGNDRSEVPLSDDQLADLHECIIGVDTIATCERNDCQNDADVIASAPCASACFAICIDCLPDHVEWYELEPAERKARRVADEVAASLNPEVDYVR